MVERLKRCALAKKYMNDETNKKIQADDATDANDLVSPENTEALYGDEVDEKEEVAGQEDLTPTSLPDSVDDVEENMFPSAD